MVRDAAIHTNAAIREGLNLEIMERGLFKGDVSQVRKGETKRNSSSLAPMRIDYWKSLGAKSFKSRLHVCHSCDVPGDS